MDVFTLTDEECSEAFEGFFIYDCAVRDKNSLSFLLLQNIEDSASGDRRLLNYFPCDKESERLSWTDYEGFRRPRLGVSEVPKNQAVLFGGPNAVAVLGGGDDGMEENISKETAFSCFNWEKIEGYMYVVGPWRSAAKRIGPSEWQSIVGDRSTLPLPTRVGASNDGGFDAIDGFSATDIYCVGGKGDAWRYDGKLWYQCVVPTNMYLESVCCAGDGYVYIGMQSGSVMRGREDSWEIIHRDEMTLAFKDMVWFDGKVWCTSDYGLWVIENGRLKEADVPLEVTSCSGNLSVGDGVMLLAGMYGATVYDGSTWQRIL